MEYSGNVSIEETVVCTCTLYYMLLGPCREEETLVDVFVIEMLVVMVNSLKLAHLDKSSLGKFIHVHEHVTYCITVCTCMYTLHVHSTPMYMYVLSSKYSVIYNIRLK